MKKTRKTSENEKNLYEQLQNLSLNAKEKLDSEQIFTKPTYFLRRVEKSYVIKKQEEIIEKTNKKHRMDKFQSKREAFFNNQEEFKEETDPKFKELALVFEKYKKLEEEELKSNTQIIKNKKLAQGETKQILFYDIDPPKISSNNILFNDKPTKPM